jgi:formate dehydrogenase beta subunit
MADKAILFDTTKCIACRACQVACKQWNELPGENTGNRGSYENPPDLSSKTWVKMEFREVSQGQELSWLFVRRACMHCTDAACVKVCPTGALYHHELGFVAYNKELCSGCGYCVEFCPFDVPRSERNALTGVAKMEKCVFCTTPGSDRITEGYVPACVKTCPTSALVYGDRAELVAEGRKQVEALKARGYGNAYLYGDKELGGLHVLYVLENSPTAYGLPLNPEVPLTATVWKDVLQPLGLALGAVAIAGLGLNYIVARANVNKEKQHAEGNR